jgi:hypothetical protein
MAESEQKQVNLNPNKNVRIKNSADKAFFITQKYCSTGFGF